MMKKENNNVFRNETPFCIKCTVEETDFLQSDLMGEYGDMLYNRDRVKKQTIVGICVCAAATVLILVIPSIVNQFLFFSIGFGLLYLFYGLYHYFVGYKREFMQMQKFLSESMDKGHVIHGDLSYNYEFGESQVEFTDSDGVSRYFLYEDIRYFEETSGFYEIGMKYKPRLKRLAGLEKVIITKRYLNEETEAKYLDLRDRISGAYGIEPILKENPFK